jgi:HlyD family secretion protein
MSAPTEGRVNLDDLRIREESRVGRGRGLLLLLLLLLIPAAFAAGWFLGPGSAGSFGGPVNVRTAVVTSGGASRNASSGGFSEGGWVEVPSYHPIYVSALTTGRVEELHVLEGSKVEKGQVVARLYGRDLRDSLRLAEAAVEEAAALVSLRESGYRKEEIAKQAAEVERNREEVALAKRVLDRTKRLVPDGAASMEDLDRDATALATAQRRLNAAEEEANRLTAGYRTEEVLQAKAALKRAEASRDQAKAKLEYVDVKSPAAGVVLERFVTPGTWLRQTDPRVVSLYDPKDLQARVDIRQENAARVWIGQKALVSIDAEPDKSYEAEVIRVEPLADFKKNTIQAKIRISEPGVSLHPEMICRVRFMGKKQASATPEDTRMPIVPESAVLEEAGKTYVFVVREGRARRTEVRLGEPEGAMLAVEAGVRIGDRVVVQPAGLSDGDEVTEAGQ